ncbi:copper resistance CopC family protein [Candidatus Rariloculus sp.]|uniref:copper resistance CopC family protein n=1 Tax=Candidatus Rariloculus sp. TaxID=3101265 RepID=UPI003D0D3501
MSSKIPTVVLLCLTGLAAQAHTRLVESTPADAAVVVAPAEIVLSFSEAVTLTAVSVSPESASVGAGHQDLRLPAERTSEAFSLEAPSLEPGEYVVSWRAVGADTHVVTGEFRFTVSA